MNNIHSEYKRIQDRLKRRMFRKADSSTKVAQQLHQLSLSLQGSRDGPYRGWFLVQAGRVEQNQSHSQFQSQSHTGYFFTCAGRVFANTALHDRNEILYFNAEEFITEAILAFQESINIYESANECNMCAMLCFELAHTLKVLDKYDESGRYFMKCYQFCKDDDSYIALQMDALHGAYQCHIRTRDFELATDNVRTMLRAGRLKQQKNVRQGIINALLVEKNFEAGISLLLVLLIQKRKDEALETMHNLESMMKHIPSSSMHSRHTIVYLQSTLIPLLSDLTQCCMGDDIPSIRYLVEQEFESATVTVFQKHVLDILLHCYENPLYFGVLSQK